jgi:phenylacetaldehyde dehydrogenase
MGPLANRQQYDKVLRLIQTARDEGDTIVCGGEALPGRLFPAADGGQSAQRREHPDARGDLRSGVQFYRLSQ